MNLRAHNYQLDLIGPGA
ncbi:unnamed protein product, partial [Rotaria sp. Silwood2]